jgi:hypothetical protein
VANDNIINGENEKTHPGLAPERREPPNFEKGGGWHDFCHGQQKIVQNKLLVCVDSQGILHYSLLMVNDLYDMIRISCEEMFDATAAAEYEQWLDEREAEEQSWERAMAYADTLKIV